MPPRLLRDAKSEGVRLQRALRLLADHPDSCWPSPATTFGIYDSKPAPTTEVPPRNRVVRHALCTDVEPDLGRYVLRHSYTCRVIKATIARFARSGASQRSSLGTRDGRALLLRVDHSRRAAGTQFVAASRGAHRESPLLRGAAFGSDR